MSWLPWGTLDACCQQASSSKVTREEIDRDGCVMPTPSPLPLGEPSSGSLPAGPLEFTARAFQIECEDVAEGTPLRSGPILHLTLGQCIHSVELSLYDRGFVIRPKNTKSSLLDMRPVFRTWSPLSLVEKCLVKESAQSASWSVFKLTMFRRAGTDLSYYFACVGDDAKDERDSWVRHVAEAIGNVTMSLIPEHSIAVEPLPGKGRTSTRIMAGYLLIGNSDDQVTLVYSELHAFQGGQARMVQYKDEWCDQELASIPISERSSVCTRKGAYCTVFGLDDHRFCARTKEEKELWLRAVSNVKVKLMFAAPDPTEEDLAVFRAAVGERLETLQTPRMETHDGKQGHTLVEQPPLLMEIPRKPPLGPVGDTAERSQSAFDGEEDANSAKVSSFIADADEESQDRGGPSGFRKRLQQIVKTNSLPHKSSPSPQSTREVAGESTPALSNMATPEPRVDAVRRNRLV